MVSSREASPSIGAFQMQFKQLGDDGASAIEDRNVRLTALLDAYELSAYAHIFAAAGYRWVTDFPQHETDLISECPSRFGILREERIRAGINANPRLYSRRTCPFIPAGLSLYSRRAVLLFPQGCPFIPAGLAQQPRAAFSSCPACADGDGRDPCRQA
jgi:hypothetical protein